MRDETDNGQVIDVAPAATDDGLVLCELEDLEVVDEVAVRESRLSLEREPLEDLHLGDDESVLAVVELSRKVVHREVLPGEVARVGYARVDEREEVRVAVHEVTDPERRFLELGREEERAETDVLHGRGQRGEVTRGDGEGERTRTPKCFIEVTNQKR